MIRDDTFVLTLRMDAASFNRLDAWRKQYFPPEINFLPAHLTLFHALTKKQVEGLLAIRPSLLGEPIHLQFVRPYLIGRGVAIEVARGALSALHARMIEALGPGLTRQDRAPLRPHVTIQNKVTRQQAQATLCAVEKDFACWPGYAIGLDVWRYLEGPWAPHLHMPGNIGTHVHKPPP